MSSRLRRALLTAVVALMTSVVALPAEAGRTGRADPAPRTLFDRVWDWAIGWIAEPEDNGYIVQ